MKHFATEIRKVNYGKLFFVEASNKQITSLALRPVAASSGPRFVHLCNSKPCEFKDWCAMFNLFTHTHTHTHAYIIKLCTIKSELTSGARLCVPFLSSQYIVLILYSCCILSICRISIVLPTLHHVKM